MQGQSWMATLVFTLIAFGGGFLAGMHGSPGPVTAQGLSAGGTGGERVHASSYFAPGPRCTSEIIDQINAAAVTLEVQAYTLASPAIAQAVIDAHRRGVRVTVMLDAVQASERREQVVRLIHAGVPVYTDATHGAADNRIILIDDRTVVTGSFNLTEAAEANAENVLIIHDQPQLQASYEENFRLHLGHAKPFDG